MTELYQTRLLVLQATPFCNIACRYCYLSEEDKNRRSRMPPSVAEAAARFVRDNSLLRESVAVLWHAGEPLALPPSYYEEVIARVDGVLRDHAKVRYTLQSNGIGINDRWCSFFDAHHVGVGISIDGPRDLHDAYRVTKKGAGTFEHAMQGISVLRARDIPFSTISVVTDRTLDRAEELAEFLIELDPVSCGFNIEETEGFNTVSSVATHERRVRRFVGSLYDAFAARDKLHLCREFRGLLQIVANFDKQPRSVRPGENKAFSIITVDAQGNLSTFSPELCGMHVDGFGRFVFGRVDQDLPTILANPRFQAAHRQIEAGVEACRDSCAYFDFCGGGGPSNKYHENGRFDSTQTRYCRVQKQAFADALVGGLERAKRDEPANPARPWPQIPHFPERLAEQTVDVALFEAAGVRAYAQAAGGVASFWFGQRLALYLTRLDHAKAIYRRENLFRPPGSPGTDYAVDLALRYGTVEHRQAHQGLLSPALADQRVLAEKLHALPSVFEAHIDAAAEAPTLAEFALQLSYRVAWSLPGHLGFAPAAVDRALRTPRYLDWLHEFGGLIFATGLESATRESFIQTGVDLAEALIEGSFAGAGLTQPRLGEALFRAKEISLPTSAEALAELRRAEPSALRAALFGVAARLVLGHDTLGFCLAHVLTHLARLPELRARVVAEASAGKSSSTITAVVLETLRYNPPVAVLGMTAMQPFDAELLGEELVVPEGGRVFFDILAHSRSSTAFPDPRRFTLRNVTALVSGGVAQAVSGDLSATFGIFGGKRCSGRMFACHCLIAIVEKMFLDYDVEVEADGGPQALLRYGRDNVTPEARISLKARMS